MRESLLGSIVQEQLTAADYKRYARPLVPVYTDYRLLITAFLGGW